MRDFVARVHVCSRLWRARASSYLCVSADDSGLEQTNGDRSRRWSREAGPRRGPCWGDN